MINITTADNDVRYVPEEQGEQVNLSSIAHESRYCWLADMINLDGMTVLDFGCGSGYGSAYMADKGASVLGVDISETSIQYAKLTYPNAKFEAYDLTCASFPERIEKKFDIVVSFDVIEHVEKWWIFVENIHRMLKPGGIAVVGCPNRNATFEYNLEWNTFHVQEFTPVQLDWILKTQFKSIEIYGQDFIDNDTRDSFSAPSKTKSWHFKSAISHLKEILRSTPLLKVVRKAKKVLTIKKNNPNFNVLRKSEIITFDKFDCSAPKEHPPFGLVAICK